MAQPRSRSVEKSCALLSQAGWSVSETNLLPPDEMVWQVTAVKGADQIQEEGPNREAVWAEVWKFADTADWFNQIWCAELESCDRPYFANVEPIPENGRGDGV